MKEYAFGIDLGGTTAKIGLFKTTGELLENGKCPLIPPTPENTFWKTWLLPCRARCRKRALPPRRWRAWASACLAPC